MKTKIAAAAASVVLAASLSAPANAAIVLGGDNGWEVSYGGFINLFYNQGDFDFDAGGSEDTAHLNEGLLPAFHTLTAKSPEINGLKGTAQITFAVDSSGPKTQRLNKGGAQIDMREVFFNVEGDFGTISAGRTLALFQRQAILKDMTLFGMGALGGPDGGGTGLGRIGFGYVYPDFRTRFTYKTHDINGFVLEVGLFDPQEAASNAAETDTPQFQAEVTYSTTFEGGSFNAWVGFLWQDMEITSSAAGGVGDVDSFGYNLGGDLSFGGFNVVGSWYDGEGLGSLLFQAADGNGFACNAVGCGEADNDGFYVQGTYTFNGVTKVGVSYGESNQDANVFGAGAVDNELWTVGVYHDVNSWLKVMAEYNQTDSSQLGWESDVFSIGGFILW